MKVLSLLEPWASLVAWGYKKIETRSWGTSYRGPVAIHASRGRKALRDPWHVVGLFEEAGLTFPERWWPKTPKQYPLGCIIAVVNLGHVEKMTPEMIAATTRQEFSFGVWAPGRFAWSLHEARRIADPIPFKGSLGLRDLPINVEAVALARCA